MSQMTLCLMISLLTVVSFLWGKLTLGTTAMISLMAFFFTGILDAKAVLACFSNSTGIMIVAMFVVAAGFNKTQFVKNVANWVCKVAKGSLTKVMIGYTLIAALLCQFIFSNLIPFCIVAPLMIATVESMGYKSSKVIYSLGLVCIVCCGCLPIGGGATVAAELNGYLEANGATQQMSIWAPMISRIALFVVMLLYAIFVAPKLAPDAPVVAVREMNVDEVAGKQLNQAALTPFQERCGYIIFFLVTIGLLFSSQLKQPAWAICTVGALAMVVTGVLKPKEAVQAMPIWVYLLFVGSIGMANALSVTGAGAEIGNLMARWAGNTRSSLLLYSLFFLVPYIATQFMFNRTTMMILYPIVIQVCLALGANPIGPSIVVQAASLSAFLTPMATGTVPYYMGLGGYDQKTVLKMGIIPTLLCFVVTVVWNTIMFPLF